MRHLKKGRELSRPTAHRIAMLRNLCTSLLEHGPLAAHATKIEYELDVAEGGVQDRQLFGEIGGGQSPAQCRPASPTAGKSCLG